VTSVDIHPEDLIDKLMRAGLSEPEQLRFRAHLEGCASCRFEMSVRLDLALEARANAARMPQTTEAAPPVSAPLGEEAAAPMAVPRRPRARPRWVLGIIAAALLLFAGAAAAAVASETVNRRWLPWLARPSSAALVANRAAPLAAKRSANPSPLAASATLAPSAGPALTAAPSPAPVPSGATPDEASRGRRASARAAVESAHRVPLGTQSPASPSAHASEASAVSPGASEGAAQADTTPRSDAAALFAEANRARRDGNAERAVSLYRALQARYPSASETQLSRAVLAQVLLERGNPEGALAGFDSYLAAGSPVLSAEALVGRARALEQLGKTEQASAAWREVQQRFPGSVHARLAATRLAALDTR
jgi:TolA-binding protein